MPLVRINVLKGRALEDLNAVSDVVQAACVEAWKIPEDDRNHRFIEYDKSYYKLPPDKTDKFTLIEMTIFPGRSLQAKKKLYQSINQRLTALGYDNPKDIVIVLLEPPLENWGVLGGVPASELDLAFKLDV